MDDPRGKEFEITAAAAAVLLAAHVRDKGFTGMDDAAAKAVRAAKLILEEVRKQAK